MTPTLLHVTYSPWSERARWALDARGIAYERRKYQPLLGEPRLRWQLGRWRGPVSVPVLFTENGPVTDGDRIATWADSHGAGPTLMAPGVEHWIKRAEDGMNAGRALSLARVADDPAAVSELTPSGFRWLGPVARAITKAGVKRTRKKYGGHRDELIAHQATLAAVLAEIRAALGGRPTLLADFSYADIVASTVLVYVDPPPDEFLRLGPTNRTLYGDPDLAAQFPDLIAWRNELYRRYRQPSTLA